MTVILQALLSGLWKPIAAILGALGVYFAGRQAAKKDAKIEDLKDENKAHEVRNEVENRIARDRHVRKRLRDEWSE